MPVSVAASRMSCPERRPPLRSGGAPCRMASGRLARFASGPPETVAPRSLGLTSFSTHSFPRSRAPNPCVLLLSSSRSRSRHASSLRWRRLRCSTCRTPAAPTTARRSRPVVGVPAVPQIPTDGSVGAFQLQCNCGVGNAGLWLWGLGDGVSGPAFNWPLSDPCFSNWVNPPASCNGTLLLSPVHRARRQHRGCCGQRDFPVPAGRPAPDVRSVGHLARSSGDSRSSSCASTRTCRRASRSRRPRCSG